MDVNLVVRVRTAVENVHHGHRQRVGIHPTDVAIQRLSRAFRCGVCCGQGNAKYGVRTNLAFIARAVEVNHGLVDGTLIKHVEAQQFVREHIVDVVNRLCHAFTHPFRTAIAQFNGFVDTCRCTGRYRCTAHAAIARDDVYFESGVAARIKDLAGLDLINVTHINDEKWIRTQDLGLGAFPNPGRKTAVKLLNQYGITQAQPLVPCSPRIGRTGTGCRAVPLKPPGGTAPRRRGVPSTRCLQPCYH